ncbi:MAG: hypothetical protein ACOCXG_02865 [Nanoarchaeota archaeon]
MKLLLETQDFALELAKSEIEKTTNKKVTINKNKLELEADEKDILNILHYSRLIENVTFENQNIYGFNLQEREHIINKSESFNPLLANYLLYLLELDKEEEFTIIDPVSNFAEILIEASNFKPRTPLHLKKRLTIPAKTMFKLPITMPEKRKNQNKITAIVQNNKKFKQAKENIVLSGQKIKLSQFELDWLDIKFEKHDFDYCISYIPKSFCKETIQQYFYMAEFITKKKIGLISEQEIPNSILKKYKLKISKLEKINSHHLLVIE